MKLAFCVEDDTDQSALAMMLSSILRRPVDPHIEEYRFPTGGFDIALKLAPIVARAAYHRGLDGAVFAVDNDGHPIHEPAHSSAPQETCRMCRLRSAARVDEPLAWPRPALPRLRYLFAVPVQAIETWLLLARGEIFKPGEANTLGTNGAGRRRLKRRLYGTEQPDRRLMISTSTAILANFDAASLAAASPSFRDFLDQVTESINLAGPPLTTPPAPSQS